MPEPAAAEPEVVFEAASQRLGSLKIVVHINMYLDGLDWFARMQDRFSFKNLLLALCIYGALLELTYHNLQNWRCNGPDFS